MKKRIRMKNVLVTGGTGTLGYWTCKALRRKGYRPIVMGRNPARYYESNVDADFVIGDVRDITDISCAIRDNEVTGIIHLAANKHISICEKNPIECVETNILGTLNAITAMQQYEDQLTRGLFMSTDKAAIRNRTYAMSKYLGEEMVREASRKMDVKINSVRMGNIFGSSGSVIPIWEDLISKGQDITVRRENGEYPKRFAITPKDAGFFMARAFHHDKFYESGTVIFPTCDVVDIGALALAMTKGTRSKIVIDDLKVGEVLEEMLCSPEEVLRLRETDIDGWEILGKGAAPDERPENPPPMSCEDKRPLNIQETREFYFQIKEQMGL